MIFFKNLFSFLFILFVYFNCSVQGQNETFTSIATQATTTINDVSTNKSCPGGHIDFPTCTKCSMNFENKNNQCFEIKNNVNPPRRNGRNVILILLACILTGLLLVLMLIMYTRLNNQHRRRLSSNPANVSHISDFPSNINNFFRSFGFNKRGRFNFFSISNNNSSSGQYRQPDTSRSHLNEYPDEALLFDDPYADGGYPNSSTNPYRSLTLAVT
ncbi:hypothetical protein I4U23_027868 [Adineta vaga]|nr:hypothetical protein I4U23_027868 [Adineta vaga]